MKEAELKTAWTTESRQVEAYATRYHIVLRIVQPPRSLEALLTPEEARGLAMILEALAKAVEQGRGDADSLKSFHDYVEWAKAVAKRSKREEG